MKLFPAHPRKILIRSTNWIGDAIMTTPAVRTIRANFPDAEITMLALPWVSDVFRSCPDVDHIFLYEKNGRHHGIKGKMQLAFDLKKENYDAAILLQNAFEATFITRLARIPVRGGYTTDGRGVLLTHGVKKHPYIGTKHQVHYYQEMLQGLGLKPGSDTLELFLSDEAKSEAREFLAKKAGLGKGRAAAVGFNPGASYGPAKQWPFDKFGRLAAQLCRQTNAVILIFGTNADHEAARKIMEAVPESDRMIDLTGKTNLAGAMALIGGCNVFVTNDSGLMHVAAALHTPTVAIFGSTDHIATGPYSDNATVIRKPLPCSPCKKTHCPEKHFNCMQQIQVQEVLTSVQDHLQRMMDNE
ncbi:MAG: lipopolysaccharide heptosyltransferase II [Desulfobulbaceae bacterium]|nr:lipopolysaccharide heptosyltransferase II [Desulfobulbaceae bacterium]